MRLLWTYLATFFVALNCKVNGILMSDVAMLKTEVQSNITHLKTKNTELKTDIAEMEHVIENLNDTLNNLLSIIQLVQKDMVFSESIILSGNYNWDLKLKSWIGGCFTAKLCWRATRDGWAASTFHANCDYKKPTVTIVKVGQYVFGGYATESWEGNVGGKQAPGSFIFSLRNTRNLPPFKAPLKDQNDIYAIKAHDNYGPVFGNGLDLMIFNNAASNMGSYAYFGYDYQRPSGVSYSILAGTFYFSPSEVEVFYLV